MRTLQSKVTGETATTCGLRKDGSVAVLFEDNTITWYSAFKFDALFEVV